MKLTLIGVCDQDNGRNRREFTIHIHYSTIKLKSNSYDL